MFDEVQFFQYLKNEEKKMLKKCESEHKFLSTLCLLILVSYLPINRLDETVIDDEIEAGDDLYKQRSNLFR